jgi:hypothetical protein
LNSKNTKQLVNTHQKLIRNWTKHKRLCIVCGACPATTKDHLPPKVLLPKDIRANEILFTFPVCSDCNNGSSDTDFLMGVAFTLQLNQKNYLSDLAPINGDLSVLHNQLVSQLSTSDKAEQHLELLRRYTEVRDVEIEENGRLITKRQMGIDLSKVDINRTLIKITKAIYWLHSEGDILALTNPGWWIRNDIDPSRPNFIKHVLGEAAVEVLWDDRFIYYYNLGKQVPGFLLCSLHFYSQKQLDQGIHHLVYASPKNMTIEGESLYEKSVKMWGRPTIPASE